MFGRLRIDDERTTQTARSRTLECRGQPPRQLGPEIQRVRDAGARADLPEIADNNYRRHKADIVAEYQKRKGTRREKKISDIAIEKCGFDLHDHARYDHLLNLPEEKNIAKALKEAMKAIEEYKQS